jgi:hypothetical protein
MLGILLSFSALTALAGENSVTLDRVNTALGQLDQLAQQSMLKTGVPGIAVVYRDQVIYAKGFGVREVGKPETG